VADDRWRRWRRLLASTDNTLASSLARVCSAAVSHLDISGAAVILLERRDAAAQSLAQASDAVAAGLEDLQLTVGEGPGVQAVRSGQPVLIPDLDGAGARWPAFTDGARAAGVAAVFSFPLQLGAIRLGSLDCYRTTSGPLSSTEVGTALELAELALELVLIESETGPSGIEGLGWVSDLHPEVHQASGMVSYELDVAIDVALLLIRGYAFANSMPLAVVAGRIVRGQLRLAAEGR
jgi:hypothetical protein